MKKILHILTATALVATVFVSSCKKDEKDGDGDSEEKDYSGRD